MSNNKHISTHWDGETDHTHILTDVINNLGLLYDVDTARQMLDWIRSNTILGDDPGAYRCECPYDKGCCPHNYAQLWTLLVSFFGDYDDDPELGWLDKTDEAAEYIERFIRDYLAPLCVSGDGNEGNND